MRHIAEGDLRAFLDDALDPDARIAVRRHVDRCAVCSRALDEQRALADDFASAVRVLDPPVDVERARARVGAASVSGWDRVRRPLLRAALLIFGFAAAAAAAVPGSPIREFAERLLERPADTTAEPADTAPTAPAIEALTPATIAIAPLDGTVRISLSAPEPGTPIRVRLEGGTRVRVVVDDSRETRFQSGPGYVHVVRAGSAGVTIQVPPSVTYGLVEVDGQPYYVKDGDSIRLPRSPDEATGSETIFRVR